MPIASRRSAASVRISASPRWPALPVTRIAMGFVVQVLRIAAASRSPERIAPSMKDGQCVAVSVPAQRIGPTGSRIAGPSSAVAPGVRKPVKQPRVH